MQHSETNAAPEQSPALHPQASGRQSAMPPHEVQARWWKPKDPLPLAIALLNAAGWLVVYFFVLEPQVAHNRAQTELLKEQTTRLQSASQRVLDALELRTKEGQIGLDESNRRLADAQVARLESAAIRLEDQLANLRTKAQVAFDLNAVRQSLRPNIVFGKFDFTFQSPISVSLEHEIRNIGANAANVSIPSIRLSTKPVANSASGDMLVLGRDFRTRTYPLGLYQPAASRRVDYNIELLSEKYRGSLLYYTLTWDVSTDKLAVATASQLIGKQMSQAETEKIANDSFSLVGSITFPR